MNTQKKKTSSATTFTTPSNLEIVITRIFEAPRELVFKTFTDPNLIPKWWGPRGSTTTIDKMELRPGGVWRFVNRGPGGNEYAFNGVYREIVPPERLVYTFEFEGMPGHIQLETVTFEEHDGKTKATNTVRYWTVEDRDWMLKSGMEKGAAETLDRLADVLDNQK